ncbi:DUF5995 family protein [Haloechinothrix salitolerans]|uniref:DUF5995 family protein n=1 Tax=Haloechinothrix salitolerans TaxID=926830 RepID=A0ABW2C2M5_9PSEU
MPAQSIDEALAALDDIIERARRDSDRRGYFAVLYRKVTANVKDAIDAGVFDDAERMARLDILFANRYLDAEHAHTRGGELTRSWRIAFDACTRWRPLLLQHLLAGINAHINLDLGIAAARCSPGPRLADLRGDYGRINDILASMIAQVQENIGTVSPLLGLLDTIGGRRDDEIIKFSITHARNGAWRFATRLAALPEAAWADAIDDQDRRVSLVAHAVLRPGLLSAGLLVIRLAESNDVARNIDALAVAPEPELSP